MKISYQYLPIELIEIEDDSLDLEPSSLLLDAYALIPAFGDPGPCGSNGPADGGGGTDICAAPGF